MSEALFPGFSDLRRRRLLTLGRAQNAQDRYDSLASSVGQAKARLELAPQVKLVLDELQRREHARSVGAFEQLLTALLQDVFPEERAVHLDLTTARGLPSLNLQISKDPTHTRREDAKAGTGGGVTNGLSLGLRLISLVRSGHRPFLILDEPDCWLETARVPAMARLIQEAAQRLGVQVLMISHHPDHLLEAIPHRLLLERGAQGLEAHWAPSSEVPTWTDEQPGLRGAFFENCYSHAHTFLPLAPGVTLLRGPNDLGKSSLVSAMTAALTDQGNDAMIRHDQDKAQVRLDFGPDGIIQFERWRKPKKTKDYTEPKVRYRLYGADQDFQDPALVPLRESLRADELPDWVREVSGIGDIEGLNVQLGEQKEPVFLLNQSPSVRARALAIGGESALVQTMMVQDKKAQAEAKTRVKDGEHELEALHRQITELAPLVARQSAFEQLEQGLAAFETQRLRLGQAQDLARRWAAVRRQQAALAPVMAQAAPQPPPPSSVRLWQSLATRWHQGQQQQIALAPLMAVPAPGRPPEPRAPRLRPLGARWIRVQAWLATVAPLIAHAAPVAPVWSTLDATLAVRWRQLQVRQDLLDSFLAHPVPHPPALVTVSGWRTQAQAWATQQAQQRQLDTQVTQATQAEAEAERALLTFQSTIEATFPACPLCRRPFDAHSHTEAP